MARCSARWCRLWHGKRVKCGDLRRVWLRVAAFWRGISPRDSSHRAQGVLFATFGHYSTPYQRRSSSMQGTAQHLTIQHNLSSLQCWRRESLRSWTDARRRSAGCCGTERRRAVRASRGTSHDHARGSALPCSYRRRCPEHFTLVVGRQAQDQGELYPPVPVTLDPHPEVSQNRVRKTSTPGPTCS